CAVRWDDLERVLRSEGRSLNHRCASRAISVSKGILPPRFAQEITPPRKKQQSRGWSADDCGVRARAGRRHPGANPRSVKCGRREEQIWNRAECSKLGRREARREDRNGNDGDC